MPPPTTAAGSRAITIPLIGLDCRSCARRLETKLRHNPAVASADFDRAAGILHLSLKGEADAASFVEGVALSGHEPRVTRVRLPLPGLSYGPTAADVEAAVMSVGGVRRAVADPASRLLEVDYVPGETTIEGLRQSVAKAGVAAEHPASAPGIDSGRRSTTRAAAMAAASAMAAAVITTVLALPELVPELPYSIPLDPLPTEGILALLVVLGAILPARSWIFPAILPWLRRVPDAGGLHALAALAAAGTALGFSAVALLQRQQNGLAAELYPTAAWVIAFALAGRWLQLRVPHEEASPLQRSRRFDGTARALAVLSAIAAIAAFAVWFVFEPAETPLRAAVAFASVLAVSGAGTLAASSTTLLSAFSRAARDGGLRPVGPLTVESIAEIDHVVFDFEGTLTAGVLRITDSVLLNGTEPKDLLRLAAALARGSNDAALAAIAARDSSPAGVTGRVEIHGNVSAQIGNGRALLGRPDWVNSQGVDLELLGDEVSQFASEGKAVRVLAIDGVARGALVLRDDVVHGAAETVAGLKQEGLRVEILSGEQPETLAAIGERLGVDASAGGLTLEERRRELTRRRREGRSVALVTHSHAHALGSCADVVVGVGAAEGADVSVEEGAEIAAIFRAARATLTAESSARRFVIAWHAVTIPLAAAAPISAWPAAAAAASLGCLLWMLWRANGALRGAAR